MEPPSQLLVAGGSIYVALGAAHVLWSLADVRNPRRFAPSDPSVREAMTRTTVRVTRGRATMWEAWLGFNLSHGLGAVIFGVSAIFAGGFRGGLLATPAVLAGIVGVSAIYLALALRFWFYIPGVGIGLATGCFAAALAYALLAPP